MGLTSLKQCSFPCGFYCEDFRYESNMSDLPKDCGTCYFLRLGSCSKGNIPNIKGESEMNLEVACMDCGKVERIEVERGKKIHSGWAYFGTLRRGIGNWSHSKAEVGEDGKLKHDKDGMIVWKRCHPWWKELKYRLIDFKRLLLRQYKDIEMWECPDCRGVKK